MSTIVGTCSIPTGHASTHAMHVVHDHSTSSAISGGAPRRLAAARGGGTAGREGRGSAGAGPAACRWRWPGRRRVQRPHSVQVKESSTCFQVRSASDATPTRPSGGPSSAATGAGRHVRDRQRPLGARAAAACAKNTLGIAVMMWKCLDSGSRLRNTRIVTQCTHQPTSLTVCADRAAEAAERGGDQRRRAARSRARCRGCCRRRGAPASYSSPPTMIAQDEARGSGSPSQWGAS